MPEVLDTAPAPVESVAPPVEPIAAEPSAMEQAITARDPGAYMRAKRDSKTRNFSPPPPIEKPVVSEPSPASPVADRAISKAQQAINERVRVAVERATADTNAELARLRSLVPSAPAPATVAAATEAEPDPADLTKYPEGQYDRKFVKDLANYEARQVIRSDRERVQQQHSADVHEQQQSARVEAFHGVMQGVLKQDAAFMSTISDDVKQLQTFAQLAEEKKAGRIPAHVQGNGYNAIAEELVDSPIPHTLMRHFTEHPEELARIAALAPRALAREFGKLEATLTAPARPTAPAPKTITSMPTPPHTVGSKTTEPVDPLVKAVKDRDPEAYLAAKRAMRLAGTIA